MGNAQDQNATVLADVGLKVHRGEILGIAGLVGAGRTEMARAVFGADPFDAGRIVIDGYEVLSGRPRTPSATGLAWYRKIASSRHCSLRLRYAPILAWPHTSRSRAGACLSTKSQSEPWSRSTAKAQYPHGQPGTVHRRLSGGNQQKVTLARWLALGPKVLIVDEPTRGIDIGAKVEVHNLLFQLARSASR